MIFAWVSLLDLSSVSISVVFRYVTGCRGQSEEESCGSILIDFYI